MTIKTAAGKHTTGPWFAGTGWIGAGTPKEGRVIARVENYPYGDSAANLALLSVSTEMLRALEDKMLLAQKARGER